MKTVTVLCDACERDLTYTGNAMDYRLVLTFETKARYPGGAAVTAMMIHPPIERTHHFCGTRCLCTWSDARREEVAG